MLVLTRCECACCKKPRARRRKEAMVTTVSDESSKAYSRVFARGSVCMCLKVGLKVVFERKIQKVAFSVGKKNVFTTIRREKA